MKTFIGPRWVFLGEDIPGTSSYEAWFYRLPGESRMRVYRSGFMDTPICKWISYS